ncbi:MAG: response regulator [Candidatus Omnitrophica bacterium]|nr:response regulator [Candidatus Omnitrophota bacterium]
MNDSLMDVKQTAAYLKMNKMTVYKLAKAGKIPAFKIASEWRFKKEVIDQWLLGQLEHKPEFRNIGIAQSLPKQKSILVVDDEEVIREYFQKVLFDYRVMVAASGEEALALLRHDRPDLVLLDIRLPGIDGIQTLKKIKEFDKNITVIMLSAFGDQNTSKQAAKFGAYAFLSKPFDLTETKTILEAASANKKIKKT